MAEVAVEAAPREAAAEPPAPDAPDVPAAAAVPVTPRARERRAIAIAIIVLASVATIALLRWAEAFFIPFVAGILLAYALRPIVDVLVRLHVPRPVSATLVLALVVAVLGGGIYVLADDFERAVARLPDAARKVRVAMERSRQQAGPIAHVQEAAKELEKATEDPPARKPAAKPPAPAEPGIAVQFQQYALKQAASALAVLAEIGIAILLAYFLLLAGDAFRRKLMHFVGPSLARKRMTIEMLREIDVQVQRYMFVTMVTNVVVAFAVGALAVAVGLDQPLGWGITAGLLHFIPYAGAVLAGGALAVGALLQFDSPLGAVAIGAATLLVVATIGMVFQTWLQSRASQVNAVAVFVGLLFFGWLWGPWGLVLGAPLIAIAKAVADRVAEPLGHLLG
jgi:predicted PurR-regulated permease PerM